MKNKNNDTTTGNQGLNGQSQGKNTGKQAQPGNQKDKGFHVEADEDTSSYNEDNE